MATTTTFTGIGRGCAAVTCVMAARRRREVKPRVRVVIDCDITGEGRGIGSREYGVRAWRYHGLEKRGDSHEDDRDNSQPVLWSNHDNRTRRSGRCATAYSKSLGDCSSRDRKS